MKTCFLLFFLLLSSISIFAQEIKIQKLQSTFSFENSLNESVLNYSGYLESSSYVASRDNSVFNEEIPEWDFFIDTDLRVSANCGEHIKGFGDFHIYYSRFLDSTNFFADSNSSSKSDFNIFALYARIIPNDWLYITFGKSQLDWSLAFAYPSAGRINTLKNVFKLDILGEGVDNINLTLYSPNTSLTFGIIPPENGMESSHTGMVGKFNVRWSNTDIAVQGHYIYLEERESSIETTISQEFFGFIFYGEAAFYKPNNYMYFDDHGNVITERSDISGKKKLLEDNTNFSGTFGFNRKILNDGFLIIEFQHKTDGYTNEELKTYIKALKSSQPNVQELALTKFRLGYLKKNHLYMRFKYNIKDIIEPGLDLLTSMPDSALLIPEISTDFFEGGTIKMGCYIPLGGENTEFALFPYNYQLFIKTKIYF